jgi:hypothetical protein
LQQTLFSYSDNDALVWLEFYEAIIHDCTLRGVLCIRVR